MTVTATKTRKLFVNLPVRDLPRSMDFFRHLGFTFDPQFTCSFFDPDGHHWEVFWMAPKAVQPQ